MSKERNGKSRYMHELYCGFHIILFTVLCVCVGVLTNSLLYSVAILMLVAEYFIVGEILFPYNPVLSARARESLTRRLIAIKENQIKELQSEVRKLRGVM